MDVCTIGFCSSLPCKKRLQLVVSHCVNRHFTHRYFIFKDCQKTFLPFYDFILANLFQKGKDKFAREKEKKEESGHCWYVKLASCISTLNILFLVFSLYICLCFFGIGDVI